MTTIPDGMPKLSAQQHVSPEDGACVMEYISMLNGDQFTDFPPSVDPAVSRAAQRVNDFIDNDDVRSAVLLPRLSRIMAARPLPDAGEWFARAKGNTFRYPSAQARFDQYGYPPVPRVWSDIHNLPVDYPTPEWLDSVLDYHERLLEQFTFATACREAMDAISAALVQVEADEVISEVAEEVEPAMTTIGNWPDPM